MNPILVFRVSCVMCQRQQTDVNLVTAEVQPRPNFREGRVMKFEDFVFWVESLCVFRTKQHRPLTSSYYLSTTMMKYLLLLIAAAAMIQSGTAFAPAVVGRSSTSTFMIPGKCVCVSYVSTSMDKQRENARSPASLRRCILPG